MERSRPENAAWADLGRPGPGSPDVAFVASQRLGRGDAEATLELRGTEDGLLAVMAYSSMDHLVDGCGEAQPWVAVPRDKVDDLVHLTGGDIVLWDVPLPADLRHGPEGGHDR